MNINFKSKAKGLSNAAVFIAAAIFVLSILICCHKNDNYSEIIPQLTAPLSRSVIGYGVITSNYAHMLEKKEGGKALALLRKGSIVEVKERRVLLVDGKAENRLFVTSPSNSGWLPESEMIVYSSLAQAETASKNLSGEAEQP